VLTLEEKGVLKLPQPFLTPEFWKAQWDVIGAAPWVVVPLLLVAFAVAWRWKGSIDNGEIKALRAERDLYKSHSDLAKDESASIDRDLARLRQDIEEIKRANSAGDQVSVLIRVRDAEQRATTIATSNNEIRQTVSEPISVGEGTLAITSRSTSDTIDE
jgi:hypothetical protein